MNPAPIQASIRLSLLLLIFFKGIATGQEALAPAPSHVLIAAHRGGYDKDKADQAPENSVANVEVAIRKGYDVYETDIQRTSDGVFVIVHDATLERETNGEGPANALTLSQLKALKKRYRDGSLSDQSVATLEELLIAGKDRILYKPDLKPGMIDHFDELARLITRLGMKDQVLIRTSSKDAEAIQKCYREGTPQVEVMFKLNTAKQVKEIHTQFQPSTVQINVKKEATLSAEQKTAIREAVALGIMVETHAYGDSAQWEELAKAGVRMLHTANPAKTLKYLQEHGWRKKSP